MKLGKLSVAVLSALTFFSFGGSVSHASSVDFIMEAVNVGIDASTGRLQHRSMFPSRMAIGYAVTSSGIYLNFSDVHEGLAPSHEIVGKKDQAFEVPAVDLFGKI